MAGGGSRRTLSLGWRRVVILALLVAAVAGSLTVVQAQRIFSGFYGSAPPKFPTATTYDGQFNFCRVMFSSDHREKQGWGTDYPGADLNFSTRLGELTKVPVKRVMQGNELVPDAVVVRLTDDWLFKCQFTMMEDAGTVRFSDAEVERLRAYLLKGGFLLAADYHGTWAREQFDEEIGRVLPHGSYPIVDLTPPDHPIWNTMFGVQRIPQMASIQTWRRSRKGTIERWNEDGSPPSVRGIADDHGRIVVVMVHNTDLPDPWEREGEESEYFFRFSPEAYRVGVDILIYALTH